MGHDGTTPSACPPLGFGRYGRKAGHRQCEKNGRFERKPLVRRSFTTLLLLGFIRAFLEGQAQISTMRMISYGHVDGDVCMLLWNVDCIFYTTSRLLLGTDDCLRSGLREIHRSKGKGGNAIRYRSRCVVYFPFPRDPYRHRAAFPTKKVSLAEITLWYGARDLIIVMDHEPIYDLFPIYAHGVSLKTSSVTNAL